MSSLLSSPAPGGLRSAAPAGKAYRPEIDGLRAVAVLSVIGFHSGVPWLGGGFVGVDVFFVISGYLICSIIQREIQKGTFSISRFYERRFKRILPALFLILAFSTVAALLLLSPLEAKRFGESLIATPLSGSNFYFALRGDYFGGSSETKPLLMTWSLAVEEQFYLFFPLLLLLLRKAARKHVLACLAGLSVFSLIASIYGEFFQPVWNFYVPVTRAWELGAGTLLALWEAGRHQERESSGWKNNIMGLAGVATILACILFYKRGIRFPGFEAIPPVLGSALFLAARGGWASRILSMRPLVGVGLISYSLYLWHWPLLSFARIVSPDPLPPHVIAVLMSIALLASIFSFYFVERPFRTSATAGTTKILLSYGAVLAAFALFGAGIYFTQGLARRAPELAVIEDKAGLDRIHHCLASGDSPNLTSRCVPPASSLPAIALMGDSHAEAMGLALKDVASANGRQVLILTKSNCPPLLGVTRWHPVFSNAARSCSRFNAQVLKLVLSRVDVKTVLLAGSWPAPGGGFIPNAYPGNPAAQTPEQSAGHLREGLRAEIAALQAAGKQVILMDDAPRFTVDPMMVARLGYLPVRRALADWIVGHRLQSSDSQPRSVVLDSAIELAAAQIASLGAANRHLTIIDPMAALCDQQQCRFADGENMYYSDAEHVSRLGALQVLSLLPPELGGSARSLP